MAQIDHCRPRSPLIQVEVQARGKGQRSDSFMEAAFADNNNQGHSAHSSWLRVKGLPLPPSYL
jgi:hypothetical protein